VDDKFHIEFVHTRDSSPNQHSHEVNERLREWIEHGFRPISISHALSIHPKGSVSETAILFGKS
jgi:hypothetical protein